MNDRVKLSEGKIWAEHQRKFPSIRVTFVVKEQTLESLQTGLVITLTLGDSPISTWPVLGPHREEVLSLQGYVCSVAVIRWEMNFRSDLEDLHRVPKNVKAPLTPPLPLDSRGETEGGPWSPTGNELCIMATTYFEGNYCHCSHNLLIWDVTTLF